MVTFWTYADESRTTLISRKTNTVHPPVLMQDQQIKEVESHKHLGVILSNDCSWQKHIDYIKENAWTRINIMRRLKYDLDRQSLETIYKSYKTTPRICRCHLGKLHAAKQKRT